MNIRELRSALKEGLVIPAHPLALNAERKLDERRQRALSRYYCDAGAGGLAVGVHTTQFEIHTNGMLKPVLSIAMEEMRRHESATGRRLVKIAGVIGKTEQALKEAGLARELGYDAALLGVAAFKDADNRSLIEHCRRVSQEIPIIGFYLQLAVGGRILDYDFWRAFFDIENVVAVKAAPFDRYLSLDVMRALAASGRQDEVALYTGNDDHIVLDLIGEAKFSTRPDAVGVRFVGGLLGHWACFTKKAVEILDRLRELRTSNAPVPQEIFTLAHMITDVNGVLFDVRNNFAGVIAGIHEVLRRQGLLEGIWCLDPEETLGPGQAEEIDRVWRDYPDLRDDDFIAANLDRWLS